jgi:hypothetical protein
MTVTIYHNATEVNGTADWRGGPAANKVEACCFAATIAKVAQ